MNPLELVLDAVAAYRLTRLATADVITEPARSAIIEAIYWRSDPEHAQAIVDSQPYQTWSERAMDDVDAPRWATLLVCRWCAGWWISVLVVVARRRWPRAWQPLAEVAACSAAAALLARLEKG